MWFVFCELRTFMLITNFDSSASWHLMLSFLACWHDVSFLHPLQRAFVACDLPYRFKPSAHRHDRGQPARASKHKQASM